MPREALLARMDELIDQLEARARTPGVDEIRVPGERGQCRKWDLLARDRVPLSASPRRMLEACATRASIPLPAARTTAPVD